MNSVRIIPRLDIKGPNLVKGINLEGLRIIGDPSNFANKYYLEGADEILYIDSVASLYGRNNLHEVVTKTAKQISVPLTVGGGLKSIEDIEVDIISSSCCGMAGSFGYQSENYEVSMKMAELSLLPRIRNENKNVIIIASGTSCRQQIIHGSGRSVLHPISLLLDLCYLV